MTLIPVETPEDFSLAQQFVIPHEETCVTLASLVRRKTDKLIFLVNSDNPVVECSRSECIETTADIDKPVVSIRPSAYSTTVLGILYLDSTIYHCIPDPSLLDADFFKAQLPYLLKKPVRCISGESSGTEFLIDVVKSVNCGFDPSTGLRDRTGIRDRTGLRDRMASPTQSPVVVYPYKMMRWLSASEAGVSKPPKTSQNVVSIRPSAYSTTGFSGGEEIIRCTEHDMETLHPLQKDYMKEEVFVPGRTITDAEVDITLRNILKNQLCFGLSFDGDIVAKANTNAIGINCVQIGGVYTHPLYRRNGYAGELVQALCNRARRAGKKPVLFVKEKNMPAFNLYQKLGFEECGHYAIAYF